MLTGEEENYLKYIRTSKLAHGGVITEGGKPLLRPGRFSKPSRSPAVELLKYSIRQSGVFDMQKMKRLKEMKENL